MRNIPSEIQHSSLHDQLKALKPALDGELPPTIKSAPEPQPKKLSLLEEFPKELRSAKPPPKPIADSKQAKKQSGKQGRTFRIKRI